MILTITVYPDNQEPISVEIDSKDPTAIAAHVESLMHFHAGPKALGPRALERIRNEATARRAAHMNSEDAALWRHQADRALKMLTWLEHSFKGRRPRGFTKAFKAMLAEWKDNTTSTTGEDSVIMKACVFVPEKGWQ